MPSSTSPPYPILPPRGTGYFRPTWSAHITSHMLQLMSEFAGSYWPAASTQSLQCLRQRRSVGTMPHGRETSTEQPRHGRRHLAAWVAATTSTTVVALRIGYFAIEPPDLEQASTRDLTAWLSARDAAELVRAAVESEGLTFVVANGISANRYRRADLEQTINSLGYHPVDDAWA